MNTFGIEVECYHKTDLDKMLAGFRVEDDPSLYHPTLKGFEYISGVFNLDQKDEVLELVEDFFNDDNIGFNPYKKKSIGATGLHIHFGYRNITFNVLDIIRSIIYEQQMVKSMVEHAGRLPNDYCKTSDNLFNDLTTILDEIRFNKGELCINKLARNKHYGINLRNLISKIPKNPTVEYRWASAEISKNKETLSKYYEACYKHFKRSITGSKELILGDYKLATNDTLNSLESKVVVYGPDNFVSSFTVMLDRTIAKELNRESIAALLA
jgi:hypothetical protein